MSLKGGNSPDPLGNALTEAHPEAPLSADPLGNALMEAHPEACLSADPRSSQGNN